MSWEMAMARALISSRPQIPWDLARGQETEAPLGCQVPYFIVKKKEAFLTMILACACWHCQEPKTGWGRGSEREARKIHFSFHGT